MKLPQTWESQDIFEPAMPDQNREQMLEGWRSAVARTLS